MYYLIHLVFNKPTVSNGFNSFLAAQKQAHNHSPAGHCKSLGEFRHRGGWQRRSLVTWFLLGGTFWIH